MERSFSFMRRILTWLRIIMITERLSDLAVIAMYAKAVTIDRSVVCEKFVALHPRRMTASSLFDEASIFSVLWRSRLCNVTVSNSSFLNRHVLGQT